MKTVFSSHRGFDRYTINTLLKEFSVLDVFRTGRKVATKNAEQVRDQAFSEVSGRREPSEKLTSD